MIHFEGDRSFALPLNFVSKKLSDAGFLVNCLPDSQISEATSDRATWKLRPKLSFLMGGLNAEMLATAREAGKSVSFQVSTKALGAGSIVQIALKFEADENGGTQVHWTGDVTEVTGLLKAVPKGLLQGTAQKVIDDVWTAVTEKLRVES
jgi:carbon monoxide dehydrogenase subunit G